MRELWHLEDLIPGRAGQTGPVDRSDRSKLHSPRLELYFDAGFLWNYTPDGVRPPLPINIKGHGRLRLNPIESIKHFYLFYLFFALIFSNPM